jgi:drug/metabolite transporter (DMT)-like permease
VGALLGALSALSIGISDYFTRRVARASRALTAALALSVVAIATSVVAVIVFGSTMRLTDLAIGALSGLGLGVGLATYYAGMTRSSATVVTPIVAVLSAVIPFVYTLVRGATTSPWAIVGAVVSIGGLVLITTGGPAHHVRPGVTWGLVSGVAYGFGLAVVIDASSGAGAWPAVGQRLAATSIVLAFVIARRVPTVPPIGMRWIALAGGVFAGASTVLYLAGVEADPSAAVITSSMFPVASVAIGRFAFGDPVSRSQAAGIAVVLAGVVAVTTG